LKGKSSVQTGPGYALSASARKQAIERFELGKAVDVVASWHSTLNSAASVA
jgi:hypothetical protein